MISKIEKEWIKRNVSFGYATKEDFPSMKDDEVLPFIAVPNMPQPDGTTKAFSIEEIMEALGK